MRVRKFWGQRLVTLIAALTVFGTATVASPVEAAAVSPHQLKVIEHNIAGGAIFNGSYDALDGVEAQIPIFNPDVLMLTEVCAVQMEEFKAKHPTWSVTYSVMGSNIPQCENTKGYKAYAGQMLASPYPMSNITNAKLGESNVVTDQDGNVVEQIFKLLCADIAVPGHSATGLRACVTHLIAHPEQAAPRAVQIADMADQVNTWVNQGKAVTVGGDFNTRPWTAALDDIYNLTNTGTFDGPGMFHEADQADSRWFTPRPDDVTCRGTTQCRTGQFTLTDRKYDYVFISRNVTHGGAVSALAMSGYGSDHSLYRAAFDITY